jgi:hypothetical protein
MYVKLGALPQGENTEVGTSDCHGGEYGLLRRVVLQTFQRGLLSAPSRLCSLKRRSTSTGLRRKIIGKVVIFIE